MRWATLPLAFIAVLLLQLPLTMGAQKPTPTNAATTSEPATACGGAHKVTCEVALGQKYIAFERWDNALEHCAAGMAADQDSHEAVDCYGRAWRAVQAIRRRTVTERLRLVASLMRDGALATAQEELKALSSDEQQAAAKYGALELNEAGIRQAKEQLAEKQQRLWPTWLPEELGLRDWLPGVVTGFERVVVIIVGLALLYGLLVSLRYVATLRYWSGFDNPAKPVLWSVDSISDTTGQSAAGALIDALNVDYNPLFQRLYTSSFLAAPPALLPARTRVDPGERVYRNLFKDLLELPDDTVRGYLSENLEGLDTALFERHRFSQVRAYENISLKLGVVEASLGAIASTVRDWWREGRPSVSGSVLKETVNQSEFASVRLIANLAPPGHSLLKVSLGSRRPVDAHPLGTAQEIILDRNEEALRLFFAEERTLSVFASTEVDDVADAVALASQRAAFRLLYRVVRRPADPGLAIAVSSYRQGIRLLNTAL
jgi:hypothetical protein